jgi:hypothetical protein
MAPLLITSQWQFKFFDVTQVKLPDDEAAVFSEVCCFYLPSPLPPAHTPPVAWEYHLCRLWIREYLLW